MESKGLCGLGRRLLGWIFGAAPGLALLAPAVLAADPGPPSVLFTHASALHWITREGVPLDTLSSLGISPILDVAVGNWRSVESRRPVYLVQDEPDPTADKIWRVDVLESASGGFAFSPSVASAALALGAARSIALVHAQRILFYSDQNQVCRASLDCAGDASPLPSLGSGSPCTAPTLCGDAASPILDLAVDEAHAQLYYVKQGPSGCVGRLALDFGDSGPLLEELVPDATDLADPRSVAITPASLYFSNGQALVRKDFGPGGALLSGNAIAIEPAGASAPLVGIACDPRSNRIYLSQEGPAGGVYSLLPLDFSPGGYLVDALASGLSEARGLAAFLGDVDEDGIYDDRDNCATVRNRNQVDADLDGCGNHCDCDYDDSGLCVIADFNTYARCLPRVVGAPGGPPADPLCRESDMDGSGTVTIGDFGEFKAEYSTRNSLEPTEHPGRPGPSASAIPKSSACDACQTLAPPPDCP